MLFGETSALIPMETKHRNLSTPGPVYKDHIFFTLGWLNWLLSTGFSVFLACMYAYLRDSLPKLTFKSFVPPRCFACPLLVPESKVDIGLSSSSSASSMSSEWTLRACSSTHLRWSSALWARAACWVSLRSSSSNCSLYLKTLQDKQTNIQSLLLGLAMLQLLQLLPVPQDTLAPPTHSKH